MKILYLSQYFPPEMGAPSARVYELARRWVKQGMEVTVLTGFPNHPTGIIPKAYRGRWFMREDKEGIRVMRTFLYATANKGFLKRILSYLSFMISGIIQGVWRTGKQDVIIASSPQFFVAVAGWVISRFKGIPFIFEVRDLWPESIVQLGQLKNKWIIRILEAMEMYLYQHAVRVITVTDTTVEILRSRGIPGEKISVIKNGVDLNLFTSHENSEATKKRLGYFDKFIVSYIGTLGLSHANNVTLQTAALLQESHPDILFLLVGEGAEKESLIETAEKENLTNVVFVDQISKQELPAYYNMSDIVLVTLRDLPLFRHVIPSKIFEIMAMARPMIIAVDGEARAIIEIAQAGIFCEPEHPQALKEAVLSFYNNAHLACTYGKNGRRFVEAFFDRDKLADDYLEILKQVLN